MRWPWQKKGSEAPAQAAPQAAPQTASQTGSQTPTNDPPFPYILFRLVNGTNLDIACEWPRDEDIQSFAAVLSFLNSGDLVEAQLAAASMYAMKVNQPEKAMAITKALQKVASANQRKKNVDGQGRERPVIPPTKAIAYHAKNG